MWSSAHSLPPPPRSPRLSGWDRTRLRLTNNSHCPVGPHHPWNLPSEVSRKSTLMPGHPHLNSAEPGLGSAGSPAGGEAGAGVPGRGAHVVSGRGTCSSDPRRREGSTAPRGRRDPPRRRARAGEGRGGPWRSGTGRGEEPELQAVPVQLQFPPGGGGRRQEDTSLNGVATLIFFF